MDRSWRIAWLLFLATLLNYLDRQVLSLVSPVLRVQFNLNAAQYSHLLSAFLFGYTAMQVFAGWIVDRTGARLGLVLAMLWWSGAAFLSAFVKSPGQLTVCLFLMGMGEAANWPTAVKTVREWFPPERRAMAVGLFNAGSSTGAILAPLLVATLTTHYSWRAAFAFCGMLGLLWIVPWRATYTSVPLASSVTQYDRAGIAGLLRDPRVWGVLLARLFGDSIWFFYIFWLPDYLTSVYSFSLRQIGNIAWIPFAAAALGNFAGGAASGRLIQKHWPPPRARVSVMLMSALVMSLGVLVRYTAKPGTAVTVISIVVFAYSSWAANVLTLPSDLFPRDVVATIVGASGTLAGIGGILSTLLVGQVVDRYSYGPVFWGLALLPLCAMTCSLLTLKRTSSSLPSPPGVLK
jgi:ACS family hexuronate transporter-like MFS transporter